MSRYWATENSSNYLECSTISTLFNGSGDLTIFGWYYKIAGNYFLSMSDFDGVNNIPNIGVSQASDTSWFYPETSATQEVMVTSLTGVPTSTWLPVSVTRASTENNRTIKVADAAIRTNTSTLTGGLGTTIDYMRVGQRKASNPRAISGYCAYLAVWKRVLSSAERDALHAGANPLSVSGGIPDAYWPMDTDTGSTVPDIIGGYDLTVVGTVPYNSFMPSVKTPSLYLTGQLTVANNLIVS